MKKAVPFMVGMLVACVIAVSQTSQTDLQTFTKRLTNPHPEGIRHTSDRSDAIPEFDISQVPFRQKGMIKRTVTNGNNNPLTFNFSGTPTSDEFFVASALSQVTNPSDTALSRLQLDSIITEQIKSPRWINGRIIAQGDLSDSVVYSRKYSLTGEYFSQFSRQCGDFWLDYVHRLILTGYFTESDFHDVSVPGHSFGEIYLAAQWRMRDMDVATPNWTFGDANNPLGYDCQYVSQHAADLANGGYTWQGRDLSTHDMSEYQTLLSQTPSIYTHVERAHETGMTSEMKLPAGGTITQVIGPLTVVPVSFTDGTMQALGATVNALIQTEGVDSAVNYIAGYFQITSADMHQVFAHQQILVLLDTAIHAADGFEYLIGDIPTWELEFTSPQVSQLTDVCKFPLIYLGGTGDQTIGDTTGACDFAETLWRPAQSAPAIVSVHEFNYVQSGSLGAGDHHLSMAVNGNIIFPTAEWNLNSDGPLTSNTWFESAPLVSGISDPGNDAGWEMYPNPATDWVRVTTNAQIVDLTGKVIYDLKQGVNSVSGLASGTYLVVGQGGIKKLFKF